MSESFSSSHAAPPSGGPLRIRLDDVPALFSEGPEPEAHESARTWWPHVETQKLRAKMAWPALFGRLTDRARPFWLRAIKA